MKYFGWDEDKVMNMPYQKFKMYMLTIPDYETDDEDGSPGKKENPVKTGSLNMFDFGN
jgi:hypothetical protein